jgi:hypothetical protein
MDRWLVGTESGMLLVDGTEFTTDIGKAAPFGKIGDAMRECIRLNNLDLGLASKFRVIPL